MIKKEKCVEYYFDSREYNKTQVIKNIEREQLEFEKKKSEINISLNEYGIYVVRLKFLNNELSVVRNKLMKKLENENRHILKVKKTYKGYGTYDGDDKVYGQYKTTKTYQPI